MFRQKLYRLEFAGKDFPAYKQDNPTLEVMIRPIVKAQSQDAIIVPVAELGYVKSSYHENGNRYTSEVN